MWVRLRPGLQLSLRRFASGRAGSKPVEPRFSESAAFQGRQRGAGVQAAKYELDYYSTDAFNNKKLYSALASVTMLVVWFGWLREPSDLDQILSTPPHVLTASLERKMLRDQIRQAGEKGEDTTLLQAQLDYVDVKEAALKIQFEKK